MDSPYHIYSDYSLTNVSAGYAFIIVFYEDGLPYLYSKRSKRTRRARTTTGELMACNAALQSIPHGSDVIIHTDIKDWKIIFNNVLNDKNRDSWLLEEVKRFKQLTKKVSSYSMRYVGRDIRNDLYTWCHWKARHRSKAQIPEKYNEFVLDMMFEEERLRYKEWKTEMCNQR